MIASFFLSITLINIYSSNQTTEEGSMFGLFENYSETAQATILNSTLLHTVGEAGRQGGIYEFILEVQPATSESFRVATKFHGSATIRQPQAGATITVKYNPKNRNIKVDLKGDPRYDLSILSRTILQEQKQQREDLLSAAPGTPAASAPKASEQIIRQMMQNESPKK
jgi:hypothetical protein